MYRTSPVHLHAATLLLLIQTTVFAHAAESEADSNLLGLARGAYPVAFEGASDSLRVGPDQALGLIDGNRSGFVVTPRPAPAAAVIGIVFRLPAATDFRTFIIPDVLETPSPSQSFVRDVTVSGASESASGPWTPLATFSLTTHPEKGRQSEAPVADRRPVNWVKVELSGAIDAQREPMFLEFSELIGIGEQAPVPVDLQFGSAWKGRGLQMQLNQDGAVVQGCYDTDGVLEGTVDGAVLFATGRSALTGIPSTFVLLRTATGDLAGVRSTNGAPFRLLSASPQSGTAGCATPPARPLGCGSTIHGIRFDYDSAVIQPASAPVLDSLARGLAESRGVTVSGHTSSEGSDSYNLDLSRRRAQAVVDALVQRGLPAGTLTAQGHGEARPIADNTTDAGRALNRRVDIDCAGD